MVRRILALWPGASRTHACCKERPPRQGAREIADEIGSRMRGSWAWGRRGEADEEREGDREGGRRRRNREEMLKDRKKEFL